MKADDLAGYTFVVFSGVVDFEWDIGERIGIVEPHIRPRAKYDEGIPKREQMPTHTRLEGVDLGLGPDFEIDQSGRRSREVTEVWVEKLQAVKTGHCLILQNPATGEMVTLIIFEHLLILETVARGRPYRAVKYPTLAYRMLPRGATGNGVFCTYGELRISRTPAAFALTIPKVDAKTVAKLPTRDAVPAGMAEVTMLTTLPHVPFGDPRFRRNSQLNLTHARKLKRGDTLQPQRPLTRAFDPHFDGWPADSGGFNVLTDFREISIPLCYPADWDDERVKNIVGLRSFRPRDWRQVIWYLEGKYIESVAAALDAKIEDTGEEDDAVTRERKAVEPRPAETPVGQCYDGAYHSFRTVGAFFLYEILCANGSVWCIDSPAYGVAFRAYHSRDAASAYANGVRDGGVPHTFRVIHDEGGDWRIRVNDGLRTHFGGMLKIQRPETLLPPDAVDAPPPAPATIA